MPVEGGVEYRVASWLPKRRYVAIVLLGIWLISLACTAVVMGPKADNVFPGWMILLIGLLGPIALQFGWFANPLFLLTVGLMAFTPAAVVWRRKVWRLVAAGLMVLLAIDAATWRVMYGDSAPAPILGFGLGYYLWFIAMFGAATSLVVYMLPLASSATKGDTTSKSEA